MEYVISYPIVSFRSRSAETAFKCQGRLWRKTDSERKRETEKGRRIAFPFPIFPANFPGHRVSRSPLAPPRSPAIRSTWEGTDECDYKWYQPAVLQEHKTANRRPARVPHSWERVLTDAAALFFIGKKLCGSSAKDTRPWIVMRGLVSDPGTKESERLG